MSILPVVLFAAFQGQTALPLVWDAMPVVSEPTAMGVPMPRRTQVKRGQVVKITGTIPVEGVTGGGSGMVYVRFGLETKASFKANGPWTYEWNTASERGPLIKMNLAYRTSDNEPEKPLRQCDVTLVDYDPITVTAQPAAEGAATITMKLAPTLQMPKPRLYIEGIEVPAAFDDQGAMKLDAGWLNAPTENVHVQVLGTINGTNGSPLGVASSVPARAPASQAITLSSEEAKILSPEDPFETEVAMEFTSTLPLKEGSVRAMMGGKPVQGRSEGTRFYFAGLGLDASSGGAFWLLGQDSRGRTVFSKSVDSAAVGILKVRDKLESQRRTERERLQKVYRLPGRNMVPYTIVGSAPGLVAVTRKLVKYYAPQNAAGFAEIAAFFSKEWSDEKRKAELEFNYFGRVLELGEFRNIDFSKWLSDMMDGQDLKWTVQDRSSYSFMGRYHKKLRDQMVDGHKQWFRYLNDANAARKQAMGSQNYEDLQKFTRALADFEVAQLALNRAAGKLAYELGVPAGAVRYRKWIISSGSQADTEIEKTRAYAGYNWIMNTPTPDMFP